MPTYAVKITTANKHHGTSLKARCLSDAVSSVHLYAQVFLSIPHDSYRVESIRELGRKYDEPLFGNSNPRFETIGKIPSVTELYEKIILDALVGFIKNGSKDEDPWWLSNRMSIIASFPFSKSGRDRLESALNNSSTR